MPVVINEIEVLEHAPAPVAPAAAPAPVTPAVDASAILRLLRDAEARQRRLMAD